MIGNFFQVTCPYLFRLNTIAYFALIKNRNSYATIARIRETTQVLLDLFRFDDHIYVHPLKAWNRYSPTMFLPHISQGDEFVPITSSTETARYLSRLQLQGIGNVERKSTTGTASFSMSRPCWRKRTGLTQVSAKRKRP